MTVRCGLRVLCLATAMVAEPAILRAHVGNHPSVHDTVAGILDRLRTSLPVQELIALKPEQAESFLTREEREILGSEHITFRVNVPVEVWILRDVGLGNEPFWLRDRKFESTALTFEQGGYKFDAWRKSFPGGPIGLGVNSLRGGGNHYLVLVRSEVSEPALVIDQLYPGQLRVADFVEGVKPYTDQAITLGPVPEPLEGFGLIQTERQRRNDARLIGLFRRTAYPSSDRPDQVALTWSDDPRTTQAIQWRTGPAVRRGLVAYQKRSLVNRLNPRRFLRVRAQSEMIEDVYLLNDPVVYRHTVELTDLEPGTTYVYCVGDGSRHGWTELSQFTTAPAATAPFSFIYLGDAQNGLDRWGSLVQNAYRERPDAAFYLMAGDLVNRGNERDDWDSLLHHAQGIYDRRPVVPALGNHECQGGHPTLYLKHFALPDNGPSGLEPERAYAFEYSNALFVILDSNSDPEAQSAWLEAQLAGSTATWKFVAYHHPAYSSAPNRDNREVRQFWTPLFDKYHVDLALQGHDHAYLRTYPLRQHERVPNAQEGTIYVVSVSGTKMYSQVDRDYTEFGMTNVSTYQVLDLQISGNRLVYRAYDIDGKLRDEFVLEK